jgi:hypothetical protein
MVCRCLGALMLCGIFCLPAWLLYVQSCRGCRHQQSHRQPAYLPALLCVQSRGGCRHQQLHSNPQHQHMTAHQLFEAVSHLLCACLLACLLCFCCYAELLRLQTSAAVQPACWISSLTCANICNPRVCLPAVFLLLCRVAEAADVSSRTASLLDQLTDLCQHM